MELNVLNRCEGYVVTQAWVRIKINKDQTGVFQMMVWAPPSLEFIVPKKNPMGMNPAEGCLVIPMSKKVEPNLIERITGTTARKVTKYS